MIYPFTVQPAPAWRRSRIRISIGCLGFLLLVGFGAAMTVTPPSFDELVNEATTISRIQVVTVTSQWDDGAAGKVIHTYVDCQILRGLKGPAPAMVRLRFLGGQVGDSAMEIPDMPVFRAGEKWILFVAGNGNSMCPLVGAMHGCYRLATDAATGTEYVLRNNLQPLMAVQDVQVSLNSKSRIPGAEVALSRALTTEQFEAAIIHQLDPSKSL